MTNQQPSASADITIAAAPAAVYALITDLDVLASVKAALIQTSRTAVRGGWGLIISGVLVCLTIWCTTRVENEAAKAVAVFSFISAFVTCGFEHVVANMTFFSLGLMYHVDGATLGLAARNLLWSGLGNLVGGALFVAGAYVISHRTEEGSAEEKAALAAAAPARVH